ncbi:MAG: ribosomal protein S7e-domain-containing protein [Olpidium bornovanus]|uniref:40S ribosomal protein S7 n=1 Tax=Olpidium bornovanus TaxID=278681 RepID=A0A8H8DFF7_9FUNG|nr:MAG: ribosomal protein S7e-domain-containing protein [Olpidium bornovanus]
MSARSKIVKPAGQLVDQTETAVAQAIFDLEQNVPELRADLRPLHLTAAKETVPLGTVLPVSRAAPTKPAKLYRIQVELGGSKKAIVVFVPVPQFKQFHKVQTRLTRELEKKFSDRHVLFVAQRRIMRKPTRRSRVKQMRPRSRTLTAVHDAILEDLVYPSEIVGKRTRVRVDGSKAIKVFLDSKDSTSLEYKLDTFSVVYKKLTGKEVAFEFQQPVLE